MKTFKIITFGCRVNQAESRMMGEKLIKEIPCFDKATRGKEKPSLVIINTCCVTNKVEREVRKEIRRVKRENPKCFLVVCGCFVENKKKKNLELSSCLFSLVDLWLGNKEKEKIAEILGRKSLIINTRPRSNYYTFQEARSKYIDKYAKSRKALVKIQEGCDNFCTYCIVPYVRGRSRSRLVKEIVEEIKKLVRQGIEEVILTGIDISDYKFRIQNSEFRIGIQNLKLNKLGNHLVKLIRLILVETEIKKISFGSIGLEAFDDEFISFITNHQSLITNYLSSHFHIPLQSGCDDVLKRMKRNYTTEELIKTIKRLKKHISNFSFSTDIIVGFPGETREEFEKTVRVIREIRGILGKKFKKVHVFRYSAKKGTLAAKMEARKDWERVDEKEKKDRAAKITAILK